MRKSATDTRESEWIFKKELQPVCANLNPVMALMVTIDRQGQIVAFNKACEQTTGYSFNAVRGKAIWNLFLIPEEVESFKAVYENLLASSCSEYSYENCWITKDGNYRRIAWSSTALFSNEGTLEYIIGTGIDITERKPWGKALNQQDQRTQLLAKITLKIRQSLQLEEILQTTVTEVRNLLQADRVLIYRFWPDGTGSGVKESVVSGWAAILGQTFEAEVFPQESHQLYTSGRVRAIEDVGKADMSPCLVEFLQQFGVKAKLVVPILLKEKLWGLLIAHQCASPRQWLDFEIELLQQLADQVSIALAQSQYQEHLEELVAERTAKLTTTNKQLQQEIIAHQRTENALRESQERWRSLVKNAPDLIFTSNCDGKLLFINRTVPGLTVEQVIGTSVYDYIPPEYQDRLRQSFKRVFQTGEPAYYETAGVGANGTTSWYSSRVGPLQQDGQVVAVMVICTEITDRKQAEEELRQSEARFREFAQREALLNQLSSQIRRSLDLNSILETAVYEIRNLLQIDRCFFLWYRHNAVPPCWEVIQEAKTATFPSLIGHRIPVTTFGPLTARVFNKEITRVDSARTLSDPVERKFFFSIGYTALLALPIHTTYGEIGVVSCGHSSGARPWRDSEVELLQAVADQLAIAIDQAQLLEQSRTATLMAQEQATKLEKALGELQQAQTQLVQSEKMSSLGQLVAGIAHEINNPISFIYGNLTYLNEYAEDLVNLVQRYEECYPQPAAAIQALTEEIDLDFIKDDLPKMLTSMRMGAERISQIVLSLRNFSRLDEVGMKWVDIHQGLDNTLLILAHRLKAKKPQHLDIQIIKDYGNLPKVQCYPGQLNQVFMNILSNAIEALDEYNKEQTSSSGGLLTPSEIENRPSTIWICTEVLAKSNQVIILIGDNGPGMKPEVSQRLFEPFFTTKPVGSGTGLGLSISYQIVVEKHRGQLQCISAPGYGAAFLISVPIYQGQIF